MSAIRQLRAQDPAGVPTAEPGASIAASATDRENPIDLLRDAIARLKNSGGDLPDQSEVATLLVEAREALERANLVGRAIEACQGYLRESRFDKAFEALDHALVAYPSDPSLVARRAEVEARQAAFRVASAIRMVLEEADWFVAQDRLDLAVQQLNEAVKELPDQSTLTSRLQELESKVPAWQQKRDVQAALGRAAALEHTEQWQAALTVLEEALRSYPDSLELKATARSVQEQLVEHERQKKLARRLELIGQRIAAQQWRQAFTLLETARKEFPGAAELESLRNEVDAGLRRSECEAFVVEVRQYLADGELEQAEQSLRRARKTLGPELALDALREELESEKKYRAELRSAQVLFGKRQFKDAETILSRVLASDRPDAQALLMAVREARAATEEETFFDSGRARALDLIQQGQLAQAEDLLRNLLALFPGNPLVERDLKTAQSGLAHQPPEPAQAVEEPEIEAQPQEPAVRAAAPAGAVPRDGSSSRFRRTAVVGTASLVLVSAAGAAWKLSHGAAPASRSVAATAPQQIPTAAQVPVSQPAAATPVASPAPVPPQSSPAPPSATGKAAPRESIPQAATAHGAPLRQFVSPGANQAPAQASAIPLPPATEPAVTADSLPALPADLMRGKVTIPAPDAPPPAAPQPAAKSVPPALPSGGRLEQAQLIRRVLPAYPDLARRSAIYGTIRLDAVVDESGNVKDVKIVSGVPVLALAAKDAVLQWKYKPATLNGKPVSTNVKVQISFGAHQ